LKWIVKKFSKQALHLKPEERFLLVEGLLKSLDEPDKELDEIWAEEAEKRLKAYRAGRLGGIAMEDMKFLDGEIVPVASELEHHN
jgi:putative addiction module component (TIGR02574 family)